MSYHMKSNQGGKHLDTSVGRRARYRAWLSGLTPARRMAFRVFQAAAAVSAVIVLLWVVYSLWANEPDIPSIGPDETGSGEISADISGDELAQSGRRAGVYTILLVGKDTAGGGNTDTMILVTYDTKGKTVNAMSLPRDTMVNVSWSNKKLNTVYNYYKGKEKETQVEKGMAALKTHVGKLTGIVPDFYAIVEWAAVGELVDAVGGVTFHVPYDMHYDDDTPGQDLHIHQEKGERRLTGDDAMQVIRWRKNNGKYGTFQIGDSGRMKIQQDFLVAVAKECLQLKNLMNLSEFSRIFTENVTTDLTVGNIAWFGQKAMGMDAGTDIRFCTMPYTSYSRGTAYVLPVVEELLDIVNDGLNPYKRDIRVDDLEVLCLQPNGSLKLTSGTLEDKSLSKPRSSGGSTSAKPQAPAQSEVPPQTETPPQPEVPEQPEQPVNPGSSQQPEQSGNPASPDQTGQEQTTEQTAVTVPSQEEIQTNMLPAIPTPVQ